MEAPKNQSPSDTAREIRSLKKEVEHLNARVKQLNDVIDNIRSTSVSENDMGMYMYCTRKFPPFF